MGPQVRSENLIINNKAQGDMGVQAFWIYETSCIFDIQWTETYVAKFWGNAPEMVLGQKEQEKK